MANQFLGLSMFIMLLSFFIILNAVSDFDPKKAAPVLNSLSTAFSVEDEMLVDIADKPSDRDSDAQGTTLDKIQGLFESHISGQEAKQNRLGTVLRIRMPFEEFEREVSSSLSRSAQSNPALATGTKGFFLSTLVSLVDTKGGNDPYKMDMVVFSSAQQQSDDAKPLAKKIADIASKIERAGLPRKMLSSGLSEETGDNAKGMVDLYFRPYHPFDADGFRQGDNDG
jgi:flagellar motor protein MotB